ncbi:MAG: hypothetical protein ACK4TF_06690, partial [Thermodesulfovibrionales bacterium]
MGKRFLGFLIIAFLVMPSLEVKAQTRGFGKDVEVEIIKKDGTRLSGILKGFPEDIDITTELGFSSGFIIYELWKIDWTGEWHELYTVDGKRIM